MQAGVERRDGLGGFGLSVSSVAPNVSCKTLRAFEEAEACGAFR